MDKPTDLRLADEGQGDPEIVGALREIYAPPPDDAYWSGLESRVMSRIAEHRTGVSVIPVNWWSDLASWAGPGLAAAALIFAAIGLFLSKQEQDEEDLRASYEAVAEPVVAETLPGALQVITAPGDGSSQREATFRYVLSH